CRSHDVSRLVPFRQTAHGFCPEPSRDTSRERIGGAQMFLKMVLISGVALVAAAGGGGGSRLVGGGGAVEQDQAAGRRPAPSRRSSRATPTSTRSRRRGS